MYPSFLIAPPPLLFSDRFKYFRSGPIERKFKLFNQKSQNTYRIRRLDKSSKSASKMTVKLLPWRSLRTKKQYCVVRKTNNNLILLSKGSENIEPFCTSKDSWNIEYLMVWWPKIEDNSYSQFQSSMLGKKIVISGFRILELFVVDVSNAPNFSNLL